MPSISEIPLFFGSPNDKALFNPEHYLAHKEKEPLNSKLAVIVFNNDLFDKIEEKIERRLTRHINGSSDYDFVELFGKKITFIKSGIGGPASATIMEELIALGIKKIVFMGYAGSLQDIAPGTIMIPTKAIRDEGTSYHYLEPSKFVEPTGSLKEKIIEILEDKKIPFEKGITWTTDAPYRETIKKVRLFQSEGVLSVEMEAASLFAVAKFRGVEIAGIFWVSDKLKEEWEPHFTSQIIHNGLNNSIEVLFELIKQI